MVPFLERLLRLGLALGLIAALAPATGGNTMLMLNEADNGRAITLRVGESFSVTLPAQPTAGFEWQSEVPTLSVIRQVGEDQNAVEGNAVGGSARVTWQFQAMAPGFQSLRWAYRRPFEREQVPLRTFEIAVTVK